MARGIGRGTKRGAFSGAGGPKRWGPGGNHLQPTPLQQLIFPHHVPGWWGSGGDVLGNTVWSIHVPGPLPGANELRRWHEHNWTTAGGKRMDKSILFRRQLQDQVQVMALFHRLPRPVPEPVHLVAHWADRKHDPDNRAAVLKWVLDALRMAGVLTDDTDQQVGAILHLPHPDPDAQPGLYLYLLDAKHWSVTPVLC